MARKLSSDKLLFTITIMLIMFGLVMVYSASAVMAMEKNGSPFYYVIRQAVWFILGLIAMVILMNIPYRTWNNRILIYSLLAIHMLMLAAVLFAPAVAHVHRWFRVGPLSLQPAELVKFPLLLYLAYHLARKQDQIESLWHGILPPLIMAGQIAFLIVIEPDLGTAVMIVAVTIALLFFAGMPYKYFAMAAAGILPAFYFLVMNVPYRRERLFSFFNPDADPNGSGFQIIQSLIAVGNGGPKGVGLANSIQKLFYLPEPHTDFIFAIIGEELGMVGTITLLLAFLFFLWRGFRIAWKVQDPFGQFLAAGITIMVVLQAMINMSVVIGLLPTKGLPLPFISSGGSSLLMNMMAVGILLNISQHAN
jgi:cell division protein FtsW